MSEEMDFREKKGMTEKAKKIIFMIIVPALLLVALGVTVYVCVERERERAELEAAVSAMYTRAFTELTESMYELETSLAKLTVAGSSTGAVLLLDDVWRLSGVCVGLMSQVPSSHVDTAKMNAFVVRAGDYARSLTKKVLAGRPITEDDAAQIDSMYGACASITGELRTRLEEGRVPVESLSSDAYFTEGEAESRESIAEFPTLIYDGPFSESHENAEAKGLSGNEVTAQEAAEAAMRLFEGSSASGVTDSNGVIPSYDFTLTLADGTSGDVSVTKTGGRLLWLRLPARGSAEGVPDDETVKRLEEAALAFLSDCGYESMRATYAQYYSGTALINFAYEQDGVIVYNDLVKVWVDRETELAAGLDARSYLSMHTERELPAPAVTSEEAEGLVSDALEISASALALIPRPDGSEALCHEFRGTRGEDAFIVYISCETGAEEQIFKLISDENGQLVI